jgi:hypothetical protein
MVRALIAALAFTILCAATARTQILSPLLPGERQTPSENAIQSAESERIYQRTLKNIPDKKVSKDPWRTVRATSQEPADRHRPQW